FKQGAAVHVFADRQIKQGKNGGRDVDQARAVDALVAFNARASNDKNPVLPVPGCRAGRLAWRSLRTLRTGFKSVVGTKDDGRAGAGELQQTFEHHVVKAISAFYDIFEKRKVFVADPGKLWRVISHE